MGDERPARELGGEPRGRVGEGEPAAHLDPETGLRVAAVVAERHLRRGHEIALPAPRPLDPEAKARHVGVRRLHDARRGFHALRGRAHRHRVGLDGKLQAALRAGLDHHRAGAHRRHREVHVRLVARSALAVLAIGGERERALAVARDAPQREPVAGLEAPVGVEAGQGRFDIARGRGVARALAVLALAMAVARPSDPG